MCPTPEQRPRARLPRRTGIRRAPRLAAWAAAALLPSFLGCSDDVGPETEPPKNTCPFEHLGDEGADIQMEIFALDASYVSRPIQEGSTIDILFPPQGGRVLFVGVRATNLSPCGVQLRGALRDLESGRVMLDERTLNLEPAGDGWGKSKDSNIASFSNVPVCMNQWSERDIFDQDYELDVRLMDRKGRTAEAKTLVRPVCGEPGELEIECRCICKAGYQLGENCQESPPPEGP